jgi:hypothetical protein
MLIPKVAEHMTAVFSVKQRMDEAMHEFYIGLRDPVEYGEGAFMSESTDLTYRPAAHPAGCHGAVPTIATRNTTKERLGYG